MWFLNFDGVGLNELRPLMRQLLNKPLVTPLDYLPPLFGFTSRLDSVSAATAATAATAADVEEHAAH